MRLALKVSVSVLVLASGAPLSPVPLDPVDELALVADDECHAADAGVACSVNALQLAAKHLTVPAESVLKMPLSAEAPGMEPKPCEGPWCKTLMDFCELFDTDDPWQIQKAVDRDAQYKARTDGIKIAVTQGDYYLMYHKNVARKLNEFLPQGLFAWKFGDHFENTPPTNATLATVVRTGTITFNLGWWKRSMFWKYAVRSLPQGETFRYSKVTEFDDCDKCPAKMVFKMRDGGISGKPEDGWKIVDINLIKLA